MASRKTRRRPLKKTAIGDMREIIDIYERSIQAPNFGESNPSEGYTLLYGDVWASVKTFELANSGENIFGDVNLNQDNIGHLFEIRFIDGITAENRIIWNGENYIIRKIIDPEERHEYLYLYCSLTGDNTKESNQ